jgi:hypothetical protein
VVVVVTEAVEVSVAEAEEAVVVIEAAEVVGGEVVEDEVDTALAQGVKSGSLQVRMLSRLDSAAQMASTISKRSCCMYTYNAAFPRFVDDINIRSHGYTQ